MPACLFKINTDTLTNLQISPAPLVYTLPIPPHPPHILHTSHSFSCALHAVCTHAAPIPLPHRYLPHWPSLLHHHSQPSLYLTRSLLETSTPAPPWFSFQPAVKKKNSLTTLAGFPVHCPTRWEWKYKEHSEMLTEKKKKKPHALRLRYWWSYYNKYYC